MSRGSSPRVKAAVAARQERVAKLYCQGYTQTEIATQERVTQVTISGDLKTIRDSWKANALVDFDTKKAEELARIDHLEAVAWLAWERSCADSLQKFRKIESALRAAKQPPVKLNGVPRVLRPPPNPDPEKMTPIKVVNERKLFQGRGNPAYLDRIAWCIETRLKILGLLQPETSTVNLVNLDWNALLQKFEESSGTDRIQSRLDELEALPAPPRDAIPVNNVDPPS